MIDAIGWEHGTRILAHSLVAVLHGTASPASSMGNTKPSAHSMLIASLLFAPAPSAMSLAFSATSNRRLGAWLAIDHLLAALASAMGDAEAFAHSVLSAARKVAAPATTMRLA